MSGGRVAARWGLAAVLLPAVAAPLACSAPSPEAEIRSMLRQAEEAAERADANRLMHFVADDYRDADGRDHAALRGMVWAYLRQRERVFVYWQERELRLSGPDDADVQAVVALAGGPVGGGLDLGRIDADLLRISLRLRRTPAGWRVAEADWEPASLSDFAR